MDNLAIKYYEALNVQVICIGVQSTTLEQPTNTVEATERDFLNNSCYQKYENGVWSEEKYIPDHAQIELTRLEKMEQSQADKDEAIMLLMLGGVLDERNL